MFKIGKLYKDAQGNTFECLEPAYIGFGRFILLCVDWVGDKDGIYPDEHHEGFTIMVPTSYLENGIYKLYIDIEEELKLI